MKLERELGFLKHKKLLFVIIVDYFKNKKLLKVVKLHQL